jgi:hypothetical protein
MLTALLTLTVIASAALPGLAWLGATRVAVTDVKPFSGLRLIGKLGDPGLSDDQRPTGARLDLVEIKQGTFLHRLEPVLGGLFGF